MKNFGSDCTSSRSLLIIMFKGFLPGTMQTGLLGLTRYLEVRQTNKDIDAIDIDVTMQKISKAPRSGCAKKHADQRRYRIHCLARGEICLSMANKTQRRARKPITQVLSHNGQN